MSEEQMSYTEKLVYDNILKSIADASMNSIKDSMAEIDNENDRLKKEISELKESQTKLLAEVTELKTQLNDVSIFTSYLDIFKDKIKNDNKFMYQIASMLYDKDYEENTYDTPVWLGVVTQWYSHRHELIALMRILKVKLPDKIDSFRLPIDWTEEELDIMFQYMYNHSNTNNATFENNLRFWGEASLHSVKEQCAGGHRDIAWYISNLPWQYVLRNPNLKKEKFLRLIGENFFNTSEHYDNFYALEEYQFLSKEEREIIINSIIPETAFNCDRTKSAIKFCKENMRLIKDKKLLGFICSTITSYEIEYSSLPYKMPFDVLLEICENRPDWIMKILCNKSGSFTNKQYIQLFTIKDDIEKSK